MGSQYRSAPESLSFSHIDLIRLTPDNPSITERKTSTIPGRTDIANSQANFESSVTRVEISGHPGRVRVDVYTNFYPDRDVADVSRGMALIGVQSSTILDAYPSATIDAYVWPQNEEFYISRATASYTNGAINGRIDSYVNSVIQ